MLTNATLLFATTSATDAGSYTLAVSNSAGVITSAVAVLPAQSPLYFPVTWSGQDNAGGSG